MTHALDEELQGLRRRRRLSLGAASALADVSKSSLAAWEKGASRPRGPALARLLDALEADPRVRARLLQAADPAFARLELAHSSFGAPVDVGMVLRAMRERRGLTQADLARKVGLTQSAVSRWEAGDTFPSTETIHAVGFALGAKVEETLALALAHGEERDGLPNDPEAYLDRLQHGNIPEPLWEIFALGHEAELWRRAAHDERWDVCLVSVLAKRANWLVGQERYDEIAAPARRALKMAKTTEERRQAVPAVAALADLDRRRGAGHAAAAEMAGAWAARLPDGPHRAWMLSQRGLSLARMGRGDEGAALVAQATEINVRITPYEHLKDPWSYQTAALCEVWLAAGEPARAAALIGGRRERHFHHELYIQIEHANGRAVTDADMAYLRHHRLSLHNLDFRRRLARIERRQAKLTGGEPAPYAPVPTDDATRDRLWAAVLRENRG